MAFKMGYNTAAAASASSTSTTHRQTTKKTTTSFIPRYQMLILTALFVLFVLLSEENENVHIVGSYINTTVSLTSLIKKRISNFSAGAEEEKGGVPEVEMEWVPFPVTDMDKYFTEDEMRSLGVNYTVLKQLQQQQRRQEKEGDGDGADSSQLFSESRVCEGIPSTCCLGSSSAGGSTFWKSAFCSPTNTNFFQRRVPKGTRDTSTLQTYDMSDVLSLLGNRTLAFMGDSVGSQVGK